MIETLFFMFCNAWFPLDREIARSKQVLAYCKCISHDLRHQSDLDSLRFMREERVAISFH